MYVQQIRIYFSVINLYLIQTRFLMLLLLFLLYLLYDVYTFSHTYIYILLFSMCFVVLIYMALCKYIYYMYESVFICF